jgi:4-amino-4-deoxy-L-arabinose transferase-like glycosyltransferase
VRLAPGRTRELVILGGLAFALRLAWVLVYGRADPPADGSNETTFYEHAAASLANGGGFTGLDSQPTAAWPPGFPFLVSLLYRAFGERTSLALGLNVVLATATVVLIYLIAERVFGRREARVAALLFAILPGPLYVTGLFLPETTFIFVLVGVLALVVLLPDRGWKPIAVGVAVGIAALTRGEGWLALAIPLAYWWGLPRGELARRAAILIGVMLLTIAPWTIRNAVTVDTFAPVSANANTLAAAHSPNANGAPVDPPPGWTRRDALEWAIRHPHKELGLIPRRLIALNDGSSGSIPTGLNAGPRRQWELRTSSVIVFTALADAFGYFLLFATLASLVLIGPRRLWRLHPALRGVLAYLVLCLVNYGIVYYGQWRFRIPMEPFMVLLATPLLVRVWDRRAALAASLGRVGPDREPASA